MVWNVSRYLQPFQRGSRVWQTVGQTTDGQTEWHLTTAHCKVVRTWSLVYNVDKVSTWRRDGLCDLYVYRCQILSTSPHCLHSPRHDLAMKYAIMDYWCLCIILSRFFISPIIIIIIINVKFGHYYELWCNSVLVIQVNLLTDRHDISFDAHTGSGREHTKSAINWFWVFLDFVFARPTWSLW